MKVLLTGATGYIGKRLLPSLVKQGHLVICLVRDANRFHPPASLKASISVIEANLDDKETLNHLPKDIEAAYYLVHSMSSDKNYMQKEVAAAKNFRRALSSTITKQVIYLSGIVNEENLSSHLQSRKNVEQELAKGDYALTTLRAGIIIGSGSASFEIIRDLVEKLSVMIAPRWLNTRCQPIAIQDVLKFLTGCLLNENTYNQNFDIGGPDVLTYKEMLLGYAHIRSLKRRIFVIPIMTPRLSSYWLYFITSTSYKLAIALVDSMKIEVICRNTSINDILNIHPINYESALKAAFSEIKDEHILSSWKDALVDGNSDFKLSDFIEVPTFGCFTDKRSRQVANQEETLDRIWSIGGETGWYYANWLWQLRGFMDRLNGGVGLRRGRTHISEIHSGNVIDFWRVIYANKDEGRLLLYAEMKLPGEAWLEFKLLNHQLHQTATFRPKGLSGRLYWYSVLPFHFIIFNGMLKQLSK
ncbi:SDR family oxidoreductase [Carboxylicivirga sediminis]|uniref:SDR family oxidoreductase n=1 Tax=Carboxylicivirga sediminis TaxID=2006564 RepID=A0A941F513_9BACT|nr:SDR family oxidoreductase [Carboxylicivirga sediminis]MBR8535825.1 SDR family oxidoreductase [Carboxylicivirga sediminis]